MWPRSDETGWLEVEDGVFVIHAAGPHTPKGLAAHERLCAERASRVQAPPAPHLRSLAILCAHATETEDQAGAMYVVLHNLPPQQRDHLAGALTAIARDSGPAGVRRWISGHVAHGGQHRATLTELHRICYQAPSLTRGRRPGRRHDQ